MRLSRTASAAICTSIALVTAWGTPASAADEWTWPVRGPVLTPYSNDNARPYAGGMHRGVDIGAPVGTAVVAAHSGTVTFAGPLGSSGLTVAIRTSDGYYATTYLHLSAIAVARGQAVAAGARIGAVGTTGARSTEQPHLHFGVRLAGSEHSYLDPLDLLPPLPEATASPPPAPRTAPAAVRSAPQPIAVGPVRAEVLRPRARLGHAPAHRNGVVFRPLPNPRAVPAGAHTIPGGHPGVAARQRPLRSGSRAATAPHGAAAGVPQEGTRLRAGRSPQQATRRSPAPAPARPHASSPIAGTLVALVGLVLLAAAALAGRGGALLELAGRLRPRRRSRSCLGRARPEPDAASEARASGPSRLRSAAAAR